MINKVVTIGGGNGTPVVNEALIHTGKVEFITSIAAVFDSGGATGRRRLDSRGREIAYSDAMRILLSLLDPQAGPRPVEVIRRWFNHRDDRGAVLGQDIFHRLFSQAEGFTLVQKDLSALGISFKGQVLPSSTAPANIKFITASGRVHGGEHVLDDQRMSRDMVVNIKLDPKVPVYSPAADAIKKAHIIILSCGSVFGSILSGFLPTGMRAALSASQARIYWVTNLVSTRNETHEFTPLDFANLAQKYLSKKISGLVVPELSRQEFQNRYPDVARLYELEHSHFLGWQPKQLQAAKDSDIQIITHQATKIVTISEAQKIVRHDPAKLALALSKLLTTVRTG